jgi:hypothetical protein
VIEGYQHGTAVEPSLCGQQRVGLGAAAGRIIHPTAALSQIIGGMTMGVGAALMEDLVVDKRVGFFVNYDLASHEVRAVGYALG